MGSFPIFAHHPPPQPPLRPTGPGTSVPAMMEWRTLLSPRRLGEDEAEPFSPARSPFHKDLDRIVFSSAFRRLQDKTQVHTLAESDYVRTRLTHSMEVASVGRSLGATVGHHVAARNGLPEGFTSAEFGHIAAAACLAHDIGNPPFGHFGEATIRDWFRRDRLGRSLLEPLDSAQAEDFLRFEGNAQGFRILARLQNWRDAGGLRLTAATLAAYTKYPRAALLGKAAEAAGAEDSGARKFGFFRAEAGLFAEVAVETGLVRRAGPDEPYWCRHPLAYLVEAADDICYHVVDLEDGYKLGRIGFGEAEGLLTRLAGDSLRRYREIEEEPRRIAYLRAKAIGHLVDLASRAFIENETAILEGRFGGELLAETPAAGTLTEIATLTEQRVFQTTERYEKELDGSKAMHALLEAHAGAFLEAEQGSISPRSEALIGLFPEPPVDLTDRYGWLLRVTDYVSGMTDSYALSQFQKLRD